MSFVKLVIAAIFGGVAVSVFPSIPWDGWENALASLPFSPLWLIPITCFIGVVISIKCLKHSYINNLDDELIPFMSLLLCALGLLLSLVLVSMSLAEAYKEYNYYIEMKQAQPLSIREKVDFNDWLREAKVNKKTWGQLSLYRSIPVEGLEYIKTEPQAIIEKLEKGMKTE